MTTTYTSEALIEQGCELITLVSGQGIVRHLYIPFAQVAERQALIDAEVADLDAKDAAYLAWEAAMAAQQAEAAANPSALDSGATS